MKIDFAMFPMTSMPWQMVAQEHSLRKQWKIELNLLYFIHHISKQFIFSSKILFFSPSISIVAVLVKANVLLLCRQVQRCSIYSSVFNLLETPTFLLNKIYGRKEWRMRMVFDIEKKFPCFMNSLENILIRTKWACKLFQPSTWIITCFMFYIYEIAHFPVLICEIYLKLVWKWYKIITFSTC